MVGFADEILGRDGRLSLAIRRIYVRHLATRPDLADAMRQANRGREVDSA